MNGLNNEVNQSDILVILFSQGLKNVNFPTSCKISFCVWGGGVHKNLTLADRGGSKMAKKNDDVINELPLRKS